MGYSLEEILKKLVGNTAFHGETYADNESLENIDKLHAIVPYLRDVIDWHGLADRPEGSAKQLCQAKKELAEYLYNEIRDYAEE